MKIEPISPKDIADAKKNIIPDYVIKTFNDLIAKNYNGNSATVTQDEVVNALLQYCADQSGEVLNKYRDDIFNEHWLDVEEIYSKAGWKVKYDKPAFCENYGAYWVFKK